MRKALASGLLLCATVALAGCAGGPKADAPSGVVLAGSWKLNHAASDDPQQAIARMRAEAWKLIRRQNAAVADDSLHGGASGKGSTRAGPDVNPDEPAPAPPAAHAAHRPDPLQHSPMMHALAAALAHGDFLTIRQSSEEFVLDYGVTTRHFTPGGHSVVSAEMGVADQTSGWEGREYVINVKAQLGPNVIESYGLSSDGKLVEKLRIGPAELPAVQLKRVYDRTSETAPRSLPTTD